MINTMKCEMNSREWSVYVCVIHGFVFQHRSVDSAQVPYDDLCCFILHYDCFSRVFVELIDLCG